MAAKKSEAPANENERKVTLVIPRDPGGEQMMFIALNGKAYNIPRGKPVEVPKAVAEIYYRSIQAEEISYAYSDEQQREMNVVQGAPV